MLMFHAVAGSAIDLALDLKNRWDGRPLILRGRSVVLTRALIMAIPTLLTNLCPTTLIAIKAWYGHLSAFSLNLNLDSYCTLQETSRFHS